MSHAGPANLTLVRTLDRMVDPVQAYAQLAAARGELYAALVQTDVDAAATTGRSVLVARPTQVRELVAGDGEHPVALLREAAIGALQLTDELDRELDPVTIGFCGGIIAMLGHECVSRFDRVDTVALRPGEAGEPEATLLTCDDAITFDHAAGCMHLVARARGNEGRADLIQRLDALQADIECVEPADSKQPRRAAVATNELSDEQIEQLAHIPTDVFGDMVRNVQEHIVAGDVIQTVVSRRFDLACAAPAHDLYRTLAAVEPAPYRYLLRLGDTHIIGASPERLVRVSDGTVTTCPIAGTRPRGATDAADNQLADDLITDEKELSEHMMLVDLGRNDVSRTCEPGTTRVTQLARVERHARVMHIVSHVTGTLRAGSHPVDALAACFPAGTLTGAPKLRAIELITEIEAERRGAYGGAVVSISADGALDSAIIIRTIVLKDGIARVRAGAGIVDQSVPELEAAETRHKAAAALRAIAIADAAAIATATATATEAATEATALGVPSCSS